MSAPGFLGSADLRDGRRRVGGQRVGHRLHGDRRVAADRHRADMDLPALAAREYRDRGECSWRRNLLGPRRLIQRRNDGWSHVNPALPTRASRRKRSNGRR